MRTCSFCLDCWIGENPLAKLFGTASSFIMCSVTAKSYPTNGYSRMANCSCFYCYATLHAFICVDKLASVLQCFHLTLMYSENLQLLFELTKATIV